MVELVMRDNDEEHFEFVYHNAIAEDLNNAKLEYAKFGKMHLKNMVSLPHTKNSRRAHMLVFLHRSTRGTTI
jgi:hypothetical protein